MGEKVTLTLFFYLFCLFCLFCLFYLFRKFIPDVRHRKDQYSNNRAEQSPEGTRVRERVMRKFTSVTHVNRFIGAHQEIYNLFNLNRNIIKSNYYRELIEDAFVSWS